jgi:hypothetical protein
MQFNGRLEMKATDILMKDRGLEPMGKVQKFIDQECIRLMAPYTPYRSGILEGSAVRGTKIGSGVIHQITPYARYQYYGKLMVSSITGSAWTRKGEKKILTDRDLQYDTSRHPLAGKMWFERMKTDKKDEILEGARKVAGAKK